jgi:hypothetical protein
VIDFTQLAATILDDFSPTAVHRIVDDILLVPERPDVLFELVAGFALLDALEQLGFSQERLALVPRHTAFARLRRGNRRIRLFWHQSFWSVAGHVSASQYRRTLLGAKMTARPLLPDFLMVQDEPRRVLIIEVKLTDREEYRADRRGILDAMAYLYDVGHELADVPEPHALVVAWNADGKPNPARIVVTDQDGIRRATTMVLREWDCTP